MKIYQVLLGGLSVFFLLNTGMAAGVYPKHPSYWTYLLQAFHEAPKNTWTPKYYDRSRRFRRGKSWRFSLSFHPTTDENTVETSQEEAQIDSVSIPVKVHPTALHSGAMFRLKSQNDSFVFDTIRVSLQTPNEPLNLNKIFIHGFGSNTHFSSDRSVVLVAKRRYNVSENSLKIVNKTGRNIPNVLLRVEEIWMRHKFSNQRVRALISGTQRSLRQEVSSTTFPKTILSRGGKDVKDMVITPGEIQDVLSFTYVPNPENEVLKSITIEEVHQNEKSISAVKKLELYDMSSGRVLSTAVMDGTKARFAFDRPYHIQKGHPNEFRVKAYFRNQFPSFAYSNEMRWMIQPSEFVLVYNNGGYLVPNSNKPLTIKSANLFLEDSRIQVRTKNDGTVSFQNLGVKNSYIARTAFILPNFDAATEKLKIDFLSGVSPSYLLKFSGDVVRVDFQNPVKILPQKNFSFRVTRSSGNPVGLIEAERSRMVGTIHELKQRKAYHIWVGSTNWYNRYQPVWMNGSFFEIQKSE
ncbi:hypothetical protein CSB37_03295 [bacterium DOLZORAL124_38_8]|nr:MAG: hypothetical protein CSB37_03295 [bacterium DOLZORAL124_38_8]